MAPHRVLTRSVTSTRLQNKTEKGFMALLQTIAGLEPLRPLPADPVCSRARKESRRQAGLRRKDFVKRGRFSSAVLKFGLNRLREVTEPKTPAQSNCSPPRVRPAIRSRQRAPEASFPYPHRRLGLRRTSGRSRLCAGPPASGSGTSRRAAIAPGHRRLASIQSSLGGRLETERGPLIRPCRRKVHQALDAEAARQPSVDRRFGEGRR